MYSELKEMYIELFDCLIIKEVLHGRKSRALIFTRHIKESTRI